MKIKLQNIGQVAIKFQIAGQPGFAPEQFDVAPGGTCEVAEGYYRNEAGRPSFIERRGNGMLVPYCEPAPEAPKAAPEAPKAAPEAPKAAPEAPKAAPEAPKAAPKTKKAKKTKK